MELFSKKRRQVAILTTVVYLAMIAAGCFFVWLRGLEELPRVYILNIGVDLVGMCVGYVLFVCCVIDVQKTGTDQRFFLCLLNVTFLGLFTDLVAWLVDGVPALRLVNLMDNTLYYCCMPAAAFFFYLYVSALLRVDMQRQKRIVHLMQAGLCVTMFTRVLNMFTGIYFTVDAAGIYARSALYPFSMAYAFLTTALTIVMIIRHGRDLATYQVIALYMYVLAPFASSLLTMFAYGLSISYGVIMLVMLLMYCVLNIDQGRAKAVADRDLMMATAIQENVLPHIFPAFPNRQEFELYASMDPAREVGGDFYDFFLTDEDHLALVIADVSGKGVPAALFMMITKALIKNCLQGGDSPAAALENVNRQLMEGNQEEMFVTVWVALLDISTGEGVAANAGHEHPAICRVDGAFELIEYPHDVAVGTLDEYPYREHPFTLHPGDCLFVYTDGVTEATSGAKELFGEKRMLDALNSNRQANPSKLLERVSADIRTFVGEAPQFDDITMMCLRYQGGSTHEER